MTNESSVDVLRELQEWYHAHCDGDWEHEYGVRIVNIDNPGWSVSIPVADTELADRGFRPVQSDDGSGNWVDCRVEDGQFRGAGGSRNLTDVVRVFLDWARSSASASAGQV